MESGSKDLMSTEVGGATSQLSAEPAPPPMENPKPSDSSKPEAPVAKVYDLANVADLAELLKSDDNALIKKEIGKHVKMILAKHGLSNYLTLMMYDGVDRISTYHSNRIYEIASTSDCKEGILLILHTSGGSIEPAYLISKTCARLTKKKFVVAIPRKAKSAGTLLALGADEIHMGLMSELGPIDPQIDGMPALGLISSLNVVAEIACKHKDSAELFARYLSRKLELENLGYYARLPESAAQYAERLLRRNESKLPKGSTARTVAELLVHHYKDHRFVIDVDEASQTMGKLIVTDSDEYRASNDIYNFITMLEFWLDFREKDFWYVGSVDSGFATRKRTK